MDPFVKNYYDGVMSGNVMYLRHRDYINNLRDIALELYNQQILTDDDVGTLKCIVDIGNIIYNNSDLDDANQVIDNDFYDLLLEKLKGYIGEENVMVGAPPVYFESVNNTPSNLEPAPIATLIQPIKDPLFDEEIHKMYEYVKEELSTPIATLMLDNQRRYRDVSHGSPELVGTLDKCKFTLNEQARDANAFDDPNVKIFERDFLGLHFGSGLFGNDKIRLALELKYDGISVEASISNSMIVRAASRGDTAQDLATDYTPILYGYHFPKLPPDVRLDCKFEAIITYANLEKFNKERGKKYNNPRSAMTAIVTSNDGALYKKYITLVPLKIAPYSMDDNPEPLQKISRPEEIIFMNEYLTSGEYLRYAIIEADYNESLFLVKKFVSEAEYLRPVMPCMYDGVVVSYIDDNIINTLGRVNSVNKYSIAIKFNTMKKMTKVLDMKFTIGQDGVITPMVYYEPVAFIGNIQTKSSIASYNRFKELDLRKDDVIEIEYRNDVMSYITKPHELDANIDNREKEPFRFPEVCPSCGSKIVISASDKSASCPNLNCPERCVNRLANTLAALNISDISTETIYKLYNEFGVSNLNKLYNILSDNVIKVYDVIGPAKCSTLINQLYSLLASGLKDYVLFGALGFTNCAKGTWKKILYNYSIDELIDQYSTEMPWDENIMNTSLRKIKGIGPVVADTITSELPFFMDDIKFLMDSAIISKTKGLSGPKIRITGFRDDALLDELESMGYDATDGSVTMDTKLLIVGDINKTSSKTIAADNYGIQKISLADFREDRGKFLPKL